MDMIGRYCIRQYLPSDILRQSRWEINFILKKQRCKEKYLTPIRKCYMISEVKDMNEILEQALLYDFYGELLTDHQKEVYEQFVLEDLSLGEIAREEGISRQGVHDLVKRCSQTLKGYEEKLHLVEKFVSVREKVKQIDELLDGYEKENAEELVADIRKISDEIIEEL